jgi:quinol-cytochrome oxidoreductase complex cytochrome b subunit
LPSYARWPRVLGLLVVVLLTVEFVTGGLLSLYYLPTAESAYGSVGTILRDVQFGWLVHQIHFWGAQLLLAILLVRLVRFLLQRVYQPPRELVWVFAVLLTLLCFHADLTGRLLPYTRDAFWSTVRSLEVVGAVPLYGPFVLFLAGGGTALSDLTLIRFYILHVAVLPLAALALVYFHFSTVRRVGLSGQAVSPEAPPARVAARLHVINLAVLLVLLFGVLASLAVLAPVPFQAAADPFRTEAGIGPPWYLLGAFGFLERTADVLPRWLAGGALLAGFAAFITLPFLERSDRSRRWVLAGLLAAALLWLYLSYLGAQAA